MPGFGVQLGSCTQLPDKDPGGGSDGSSSEQETWFEFLAPCFGHGAMIEHLENKPDFFLRKKKEVE